MDGYYIPIVAIILACLLGRWFIFLMRETTFTITDLRRVHPDTDNDWKATILFKRGTEAWRTPVRGHFAVWRNATTGERMHINIEMALEEAVIVAKWNEEKP